METCIVVLLLSLWTKSYGVTIQMKPLQQYFCMVPFVFFNILQNDIWDFSSILIFGSLKG